MVAVLKVVAKMNIASDEEDAVVELAEELVASTLCEEGCISYNFCHEVDENVDDSFAMMETWESQEALDKHMQSEHFTRLLPQIQQHCYGELIITIYEVLA